MTDRYQQGQELIGQVLASYVQEGATPEQACEIIGDWALGQLSHAQKKAQSDPSWEPKVEEIRGWLSRETEVKLHQHAGSLVLPARSSIHE